MPELISILSAVVAVVAIAFLVAREIRHRRLLNDYDFLLGRLKTLKDCQGQMGNSSAPAGGVGEEGDAYLPSPPRPSRREHNRHRRHESLQQACRLLEETDMLLEDVADEAGFGSRATFFRLFKERYDMTPAEYRRLTKKD